MITIGDEGADMRNTLPFIWYTETFWNKHIISDKICSNATGFWSSVLAKILLPNGFMNHKGKGLLGKM